MTCPPSRHPDASKTPDPSGSGARRLRLLVVEPLRTLPLALRNLDGLAVEVTRLDGLNAELIGRVRPDMLLAPLLTRRFDILDLAARLEELGFSGALRAYTRPLPNLAAIRAEVCRDWPAMDFDILELPPEPDTPT